MRHLFDRISHPNGNFVDALQGNHQGLNPLGLLDQTEFLPRANQADAEITFAFSAEVNGHRKPVTLVVTLHRSPLSWTARLDIPSTIFDRKTLAFTSPPSPILNAGAARLVDLSPLFAATHQLVRTCYLPAFRNAINAGAKGDYYDISVGQAFVQLFREWKTGHSIAQNEATRRLISDIQQLFGFQQFDINPSPDNTTLQLFINDRSFRLHELGSGLAQFILVFANVAVRQPAFILIDEPELSLHPSLQLKFLSRLAAYASGGVLFATHSYGLARSSADQIYTLRKIAEGESAVSPLEVARDLPTLLEDLTYSGYRDLGFEKILLVEGPHDLPVFRHFLRLLRKDHRVVLLSLGGSDMINGARGKELEELKRISPSLAAIIDSERSSSGAPLSKNRIDFKRVCDISGVACHILDRRATENYFTDAAVQKVKGPSYRALGPFERFRDIPLEWSKDVDNWQATVEMTLDDLTTTDLGRFLASL